MRVELTCIARIEEVAGDLPVGTVVGYDIQGRSRVFVGPVPDTAADPARWQATFRNGRIAVWQAYWPITDEAIIEAAQTVVVGELPS
jgi:hypothetical protein